MCVNYSAANINYLWGHLIVEELVRNNVTHFCISPGSRSAPLTVAAAGHAGTETIICLDERGAAFYALGYARATGKPAALICTSGTAAANYYPAIVEAHQSDIPVIILTADRPPELRESGANQTIDQVKLYGNFVHWFFEIPCPHESLAPEFVLTTIDQAVNASQYGPVHLNCMFREPLAPDEQSVDPVYLANLKNWQNENDPYTVYSQVHSFPGERDMDSIGKKINEDKNGLIVIGQGMNHEDSIEILQLAHHLNWPVFADISSGIARNVKNQSVVNYFDLLLLNEQFRQHAYADLIIQFGKPPTSKRLLQFIKDIHPQKYIVVEQTSRRFDPDHRVTTRLNCRPANFCKRITEMAGSDGKSERNETLKQFDRISHDIVSSFCSESLSEISVAHFIAQDIRSDTGLFLGSSMPIRDMDMFASFSNPAIHIEANRGASGIDGTLASAAGFAKGIGKAVTVLIGDIAALHDLNSLSLIQKSEVAVHVVIVNNDGGGIFSFLPIARFSDVIDYFTTAHGFDFSAAAKQFQLSYEHIDTTSKFRKQYQKISSEKRSSIIEVPSDVEINRNSHQIIQNKFTELRL
jgi:2-succinyl-5-enolpyruvyl-6-hydroxy-3-cyclohexene-1-carboxylate synthase